MDTQRQRGTVRADVRAITLAVLVLGLGPLFPGGQAAAQLTFTNITKPPGARLDLQPGDRFDAHGVIRGESSVAVQTADQP